MNFFYITLLFLTLLGAGYSLIGHRLRRMEQEEKDRVFFDWKKDGGNFTLGMYEFFSNFILTRYWIRKVKHRMDTYSPGNDRHSIFLTMQLGVIMMLVVCVDVIIIIVLRPSWVMTLILLSAIYFIHAGMSQHIIEREETRLLAHLVQFLSDIRHCYHSSGMIEDCIEMALHDKTPEDIRLHGICLLDIITSEDAEEKMKDYLENVPNVYLKELLTLCVTVVTFGDHILEGQSLFLTSLRNLKQSLNTELLRRKRQKHMFGGYAFIIVAPIFSIPFISSWALNTMPSLEKYYQGSYGILFPIFSFLIILFLFQINLELQQSTYQLYETKTPIFYLCRIPWIHVRVRAILSYNQGKRMRIDELIRESGKMLTAEELKLRQIVYAILSFISFIAIFISLPGSFHLSYFLSSLMLMFVFYFIPFGMLKYQCYLAKHAMLDEVMQFQSVIFMLSPIPQMSPELILSWLEHFAVIFRKSISSCIDFMGANEEESLEQLYEMETYEPFQRLMGNLKVSDRIGLSKAFDELGAERIYFQEERRQKGEMSLENKGAVGAFISMIPTFLIVAGYLFLPFIIESFSLFGQQLNQINF